VVKPTGSSQPAGSGCAASASAISYDANGNTAAKTDFNGHKTCFAYDLTRNLETARVEGLASMADCAVNLSASTLASPLRKTSSQWHPDWRLLTREASPKLVTTYVYNGRPDPTNGNALLTCAPTTALVDGKPIAVLCKKHEQATTDASGALGFSAAATGTPRVWTYTYNNYGQVLTENGPRTDVNDTTTTTYYADNDAVLGNRGNVKDITNALGQKTTYNSYDANGRVTKITAPNGSVTDLAYFPRGWLKTLSVTGGGVTETTGYTYFPTGQVKTVTAPDSSVLTYGYDAAQRLTGITDSLGNKVAYTLDAMGNRTKEEYKDPSNVLRRNIERGYDALNRLQTLTGEAP
jgi:YD repeat-containing protein